MLREPAGAQAFGRLVHAVFGEAILRAQTSEGLRACELVGTRNAASSLPSWVSLHAPETLHRLGEQGIIELAGAFKMSMQPGRLLRVHLQGQAEDKRGRWLGSHAPSIENILSIEKYSTTIGLCQTHHPKTKEASGTLKEAFHPRDEIPVAFTLLIL